MTLNQLKKFCVQDRHYRGWMHKPYIEGNHVVACNGHIAVRTPLVAELADIGPVADRSKTDVGEVIQKACDQGNAFLPIPELPPALPCEHCKGSGKAHKCTSCDGEGQFDHDGFDYECQPCSGTGQDRTGGAYAGEEQPCYECGGTGESHSWQPVHIGNANFDRRYLAIIASLGNAKIAPAGEGVTYFTADGCDGAIMPTRA